MNREEIRRIAAEVSAVHGIRVDQDDPIMAVVTLNCLVMEQLTSDFSNALAQSTRQLTEAADRVQIRAGAAIAEELKAHTVATRRVLRGQESAVSDERPRMQNGRTRRVWLQLWTALAIFMAGIFLGTLLK